MIRTKNYKYFESNTLRMVLRFVNANNAYANVFHLKHNRNYKILQFLDKYFQEIFF